MAEVTQSDHLSTTDVDMDQRTTFLNQMRRVPGAIAIVAAAVASERTGLAATAWNSLCADPPMLLACVNKSSSLHAMLSESQAFSISLLPRGATETIAIFSAQRGLVGKDRFLFGQWSDGPQGQPMFNDAVASFECTLEATHDYGTHSIIIGRVGEMMMQADQDALLYLDGQFTWAASAI